MNLPLYKRLNPLAWRNYELTLLLNDSFDTPASAPLTTPRTAEPGPGTEDIVDTGPVLSIVGDQLTVAALGVAAGDPRILSNNTFTRENGLALLARILPVTTSITLAWGWTAGTSITSGIYFVQTGEIRVFDSGVVNAIDLFTANTRYLVSVVMRGTGAFAFIKGGKWADWTLLWVGTLLATDMKAGMTGISGAVCGGLSMDYMRVFKLPDPFLGDYDIASFNLTSSTQSLGSELLTDPGIETWASATDATNYTETLAGTSTVNKETSVVHGGSNAARLDIDGSNSDSFISQAITNSTGDLLEITYWAKDSTTSKTARVDLDVTGITHTLTTTYQQFRDILRAGSANVTAKFRRVTGTSSSVYFDDVSIKNITKNTAQTMKADSIVGTELTLPGTPQPGQAFHLLYRINAAGDELNNCWDLYLKRNEANSAWDILLDSIVAGVRTNRVNVTGVSTPDAIRVRCHGENHDVYTRASGGNWTHRGTLVTNSLYSNATIANVVYDSGFSLTRFVAYPLRSTQYNALDIPRNRSVVNFLIDDEFLTDVLAPLASSRSSEPGPGLLKKGADTSNIASIVSSKFDVFGTAFVNFTDPFYYLTDNSGNGIDRVAGRAMAVQFETKTNGARPFMLGLARSTTGSQASDVLGIYFASSAAMQVSSGSLVSIGSTWTIGLYDFVFVELATGGLTFGKGGILGTTWQLLWTDYFTDSSTPLWPGINGVASTDLEVDFVRMADLGSPFNGNYLYETVRDTTLASGDTFTGTADGIFDFEFTLPSSPSAGDIVALEYRRQGANDKWRAYLQRNAGNTAWDFNLDSVVASTPTNRINVTGVGAVVQIRVIAFGNLHDAYKRIGTTWTKLGAQVNVSTYATEVGLGITAVAGTTLTAVTSAARTPSASQIVTLESLIS